MSRFPGSLALVPSSASLTGKLVTMARSVTLCVLGGVTLFSVPVLAQTATTTTLAITSGGSAVTTVPFGAVVTLTATVTAGATPVSPGQVNFCDAGFIHCEDIHIIGTAQLTSAGTAIFKFRPGVSSHSYKAVFLGTPGTSTPFAASTSSNGSLTVTGSLPVPTVTDMSAAGTTGSYELNASVSTFGLGDAAPTGTVSFLDTSNGNALLGTAPLSNTSSAFGLASVSNPAGGGPILVADFNQDGIPDLFVPNTVFLGKGDGTFTPAASSLPGPGGEPAVVGDFNGDGIPDLALADGSVTIELGKGDGTFRAGQTTSSLGYFSVGIVAGDFNGDGNLDLAVLSPYAGVILHAFQISILLGHGDGTFSLGPTAQLNNGALTYLQYTSLAVADFNGDGKLDIVAASEPAETCDGQSSCNVGSLTILLGNGDGTFNQSTIDLGARELLGNVVAADLNGDGIPDLAVTINDLTGNYSVDLLLGNGDGTFAPQTSVNLGADAPQYLAVGDLNGDGIPDLALTYSSSSGLPAPHSGLMLFFGKGDGTFNAPPYQFPPTGIQSSCCASGGLLVGDFNGDGLQDLATPGSVLLSQNQFATTPQIAISLNGVGTHLVEAQYSGDVNYAVSTSVTTGLNGAAGTPSVSLTLSANTVNFGTPVTVTSTVSGSGPTPTGSVNFAFNAQPGPQQSASEQCFATLDTNGNATCTTTADLLGGGTYSVVASYSGDNNYPSTNSSPVSLAVFDQSTPKISWPTPTSITYGTALSATQLDATSGAAGTFSYSPAAGTVLGGGTQTLSVTFTPTFPTAYTTATATVTILVTPAFPPLSWTPPSTITYGTALSATQLNASSTVAGSFVYTPAAGTVLDAGTDYSLSVTFTPTDTTDYKAETAGVQLTVLQAGPTITWSPPAPINSGTALSAAQLNATSSVPGTFAYSPTAGTLLPVGSQTLSATFTPTNTKDYTTATSTVTINVIKAQATISWATPGAITYGTALGATQLSASSPVAGTFVYTPAAGTVLSAGTHTLSVTFTPNDTVDYGSATATVMLTVSQASPTITWSAPAAITYGTALGPSQLSATSTAVGTFVYTPSAGTVLGTGTQTLSVAFTPTDTTDYTTATANALLNVEKATPAITWSTPAAIMYGTALSSTQLNAASTAAGTFVYTPAAGTVLAVGSQTLSVAFTPTDAADYTTANSTVMLAVNKAVPTIALASSGISAYVLNPVIFTATLSSPAGTPTGTVAFYDGMALLGTESMTSGVATYQTSALLAGTHSITAVYSGDTNFATVTSGALSQVIENFTIGASGGTSSVTANPGGQAVYTFTVTPPTGTTFAGPISFSVTGLPTGATAAFAPTTVPAGAGTTTVTMTVTLPTSASARPADKPFPGGSLPVALGLILLPFAGLPFTRRLRRAARGLKGTVSLLVIALALAAGFTACGGSGGGGAGSSSTPENYILTVTATSGSLSNTFAVGLVVE